MTTGQSLALDERPPGNPAAVADYGRDGDLGGGFVCNIRSSNMLPSARPAGSAVKAVVDDAAASTLC
jgi:hypothetical protein